MKWDLGFSDLLGLTEACAGPAAGAEMICVQPGFGFVPGEAHLNKNKPNRVAEAERKQHKRPEKLNLDEGQTGRGVKRSAERTGTKEQFTL